MKKIYALAFASSALLLGSCASDAPEMVGDQNKPGVEDNGDGYYVRVNFGAPTRAEGDMNNPTGTPASDGKDADPGAGINNAAFIFFDANGTWISTRYIGYKTVDTEVIDWVSPENGNHPANKCAVMKLSKIPAYVQCVVNAHDDQDDVKGDLGDINNKTTWFRNEGAKGNYFTMSSAVTYPSKEADAEAVYSTVIEAKHLFTTKEAATDGTEEGKVALQIYVEPIVAKVVVNNGLTLTDGKVNVNTGDGEEVNGGAVVNFTPSYVFLTGYSVQTPFVKKLPKFGDLRPQLQAWSDITAAHSVNWVGATTSSVSYPTFAGVSGGDDMVYDAHKSKAATRYSLADGREFYPFENNWITDLQNRTSIVVAGTYTPTTADGTPLYYTSADAATVTAWNEENKDKTGFVSRSEQEGTFYLVGVGEKFDVYKTEYLAIQAAGGDPVTDKLVPEGVSDTSVTNDWKSWTGKMQIAGKPGLLKVIKYYKGHAYYPQQIRRVRLGETGNLTSYYAIVRNTEYTLNINGILGMGIGLPSDDTPIIPNIDVPDPKDEERYLHIGVTVNKWVSAPAQDVIFGQ